MSAYRIFAGATAGVSALILLLTQMVGGPKESAAPVLEPLPAPSVLQSPITAPSLPPQSSPTTGQPPDVGTIVYEHDFSSPEDGLLGGQSQDAGTNEFGARSAVYSEGRLSVHVESHLATYVAGASTEGVVGGGLDDLGDVSIEVDATPIETGAGASWGLSCRRQRGVGSFYYAFLEDAGGHARAGIIRQDEPGGEWIEIASEPIVAEVLIGEGVRNSLRLDCIGSTLTLYADGVKVVVGTDSTYSSGSAALFANPFQDGEADVLFDDLIIREA
ncbi:MAG: hypothetical protein M3135_05385 [Actinomycetota bacterium]|nr:hypothetical protein [Actinomycetota bacterium]